MTNRSLSPLTSGYKPSFLAVVISISIGYLVLSTPSLPPSDIPKPHFPLPHPTLHDLAFSSAALTYLLGITHLIIRMSKPTVSATGDHFSMVTLCAACATFILGLLFVLTSAIPDLLAMCAGGGQGGGGGGHIEDVMNLFMQNRKFGR